MLAVGEDIGEEELEEEEVEELEGERDLEPEVVREEELAEEWVKELEGDQTSGVHILTILESEKDLFFFSFVKIC